MELPYDITCPFCFESFTILIDTSGGDCEMVQDCEVCCRPMKMQVECEPGEIVSVTVEGE